MTDIDSLFADDVKRARERVNAARVYHPTVNAVLTLAEQAEFTREHAMHVLVLALLDTNKALSRKLLHQVLTEYPPGLKALPITVNLNLDDEDGKQ